MISRYQIGNAQTIGSCEVQSNYFSTAYNDEGNLFAVLADGTIDHPNGRKAAIMAVEYCVDSFLWNWSNVQSEHFLLDTALRANKHIKDAIYIDRSPRLSLTMILFKGRQARYFNVGVNRIYLYNRHNERLLGDNAVYAYSNGIYELSSKNIVGILSSGAYADSHPMERIKIVGSGKKAYDKAQDIVESINGKGLNHQMNATALLIEVVK